MWSIKSPYASLELSGHFPGKDQALERSHAVGLLGPVYPPQQIPLWANHPNIYITIVG